MDTRRKTTDLLDRPALYYPYIHIRSEHWLKATLLCVPSVKRIVPETYIPEDDATIRTYTEIAGPNGPLLQSVPADSHAAHLAQNRLLDKLQAHRKIIGQKYGCNKAPKPDEYWIHQAKFNDELLHYLVANKLAWPSTHSRAYGHRSWYALHPVLGSAIMTILGISIAREQKYDIVTPSNEFHEALLATREEEVFNKLLTTGERVPAGPIPPNVQARHQLGQLVVALTGINYQALRPEEIPELQASKHFRAFQHLLRTTAQTIDRDVDPEIYHAQLVGKAQEIIEAWHNTRGDLSGGVQRALFQEALTLSPQALTTLLSGTGLTELAIAGGLAVARLISKVRFKKRRISPYQYLTEIERAQNEFLRMEFPLGLES